MRRVLTNQLPGLGAQTQFQQAFGQDVQFTVLREEPQAPTDLINLSRLEGAAAIMINNRALIDSTAMQRAQIPILMLDRYGDRLRRVREVVHVTEPFPLPEAPSDELVRIVPRVYFDGRVVSLWYFDQTGVVSHSVGHMMPGEYPFGPAERRELTQVVSGWMMINGVRFISESGQACRIHPGEDVQISTTVAASWITHFD